MWFKTLHLYSICYLCALFKFKWCQEYMGLMLIQKLQFISDKTTLVKTHS